MNNINTLLLKQREEFEELLFELQGQSDFAKYLPSFHREKVKSFLSTIQQEILQAVKEKVEGMKKEVGPAQYEYHQALSDLSSWLEGDKK